MRPSVVLDLKRNAVREVASRFRTAKAAGRLSWNPCSVSLSIC
jgi:hypothetical protein